VSPSVLLPNSLIDRMHTMGLNPEVPAFNPPCTARDMRAFAPALQQFMLCFHFDSVKKM